MNLYIFNETRRGAVYGIGTYIRELTFTLKDFDIHICVVNLLSDKPQIQTEEIEGIKYWYFPTPIPEQRTSDNQKQRERYFRNVVYLLQLHIKGKSDLIFHLNYHQNGSLIEELKKTFDCRIVSVAHFSDWGFTVFDNLERLRNILNEEHPDSFGESVKKSFEEEKSYYEKVDHTICLSNYMQEIMCRDYGLDPTKISVISNGLYYVADPTTNSKLLRKKWNIQAREKIILSAGRIDEIKGLSYLIKAFREVLKRYPKCRLMIAGSGNYDTYFQEAKDICTKITFTGLLEKDELYELYRMADIGVVPSLFEPFGYVAVEMMMHGLPLVATATSGLNEVVDESFGLKVPIIKYTDKVEVDVDILAENILYLLLHSKEARKLGKNGHNRYKKTYTSEIFGQKMFLLYQSFIH
jgi:glycosyltransferase